MVNVVQHRRTKPTLPTAEIAALSLSLAHLGRGPHAAAARRVIKGLLADQTDDVVAATLTTLARPLDPATARRAKVIAGAISERRVAHLFYRDVAGTMSVRDVDPVTCLVHRDYWYLVAWCRLRQGVRAFRFDRIVTVEAAEAAARAYRTDRFLPFQRRSTAA